MLARRSFVLALVFAALVAPARAGFYHRLDFSIPVEDGVSLDASIYIPNATPPAGGFPLIVRQHGGGSNKDSTYDVTYGLKFVESGNFALLMYSARGHGNSGGIFDFFGPSTTHDFSRVLDFIGTELPGVVDVNDAGLQGYSQGGGESLLPAENDPRVKAVAVGNTFSSLNSALNPNDCFKFSFATGIFALAYKQSASKTDDVAAVRWGTQFYTDTEGEPIPALGLTPGTGPDPISTTEDLGLRSPLTFVRPDPTRSMYANGLNVPTFWSNSWEDNLFPANEQDPIIDDLRARGIPTHLWFASGGHEVPGGNDPADEGSKEHQMMLWFDEFLRGVDHGFASGEVPPVEFAQRQPDGTWVHKTATAWPIPDSLEARWFFAPLDRLCAGPVECGPAGDRRSLKTIVNDGAAANLATDPILRNRAGAAVGLVPDSANPIDTATFTGYPLARSLEATGAPKIRLDLVKANAAPAQVNVKVWDQSPAGSRQLVWRGCETIDGETFDFNLWPNSHVFPSGNQIVVTVSTVDTPTFKSDPSPQLLDIWSDSYLELPVTAGSGTRPAR